MADDNDEPDKSPSSKSQNPQPSHAAELQEIKDEVLECLTNIKVGGDFGLSQILPCKVPHPEISLASGHTIELPLSDVDVQAVVAASQEALLERSEAEEKIGMEFLQHSLTSDETHAFILARVCFQTWRLWEADFTELGLAKTQKTWEVFPDDFEIGNSNWQLFVDTLVAKISAGVGIDPTGEQLSAELHNMVLHEAGATIRPTVDDEDVPNLFGNLVIALHSGDGVGFRGDVNLTHAGQARKSAASKERVSGFTYRAWLEDITKVIPVAANRLLLVYNLSHSTLTFRQRTTDYKSLIRKLDKLLKRWTNALGKHPSMPQSLAFLLQHKSTDAKLRYNKLSTPDKQFMYILKQAFANSGCRLYLSNVHWQIHGRCNAANLPAGSFHPIIEERRKTVVHTKIVTLDGTELAPQLEFYEETLMPSTPLKGVDPDKERYVHWIKEAVTHLYDRTIAVIVPNNHRVGFCFPMEKTSRYADFAWSTKIVLWIDRATACLTKNPGDKEAREDLEQICRLVIRNGTDDKTQVARRQFSPEVFSRNIQVALDLGDKGLFVEAYRNRAGKAILSMCKAVATGIFRYGLNFLLADVAAMLSNENKLSFRLNMIDQLRYGFSAEAERVSKYSANYLDWLKFEVNRTLSSDKLLVESAEEGCGLVKLSTQASNRQVFDNILPAVKRNIRRVAMVLGFLVDIFEAGQSNNVPEDVSQTLFRDVFSDLAGSINFSLLEYEFRVGAADVSSTPSYSFQPSQTDADTVVGRDKTTGRRFALLISYALSLSLEEPLRQMVSSLVKEAATDWVFHFDDVYLPAFQLLGPILQAKNFLVKDSPIAGLMQSILRAHIVHSVKAEPMPSEYWKRPEVCCDCKDCCKLNAFLVDPTQHVWRFAASQARRKHVQECLLDNNGDDYDDDGEYYDDERNDYNIETERGGSPFTMVVTKNKLLYYDCHKNWAMRRDSFKKKLQSFDQDFLRSCLGDKYDAIVSVNWDIILPAHEALVASFQTSTEKNPPSRVPSPISKRKIPAPANSPKKSPENVQG